GTQPPASAARLASVPVASGPGQGPRRDHGWRATAVARRSPGGTGRRVIVVPVSVRGTAAVRDALLSHGWEGEVASLAAGGLAIAGFHVHGVPQATLEAMVPLA